MKSFTIAAILMGALAVPASAQELEEVPVNGVARLSLVSGDVIVRRGDSGEFIAGESNAPLVASDHVSTGEAARAEIQFDWANMIRLAATSEVRLGELEDGNFFIQLADGTATLSVLRESSSLIEISTPTVSLRPLDMGTYRMTVRADGSTQITVRSGEAEIFTTGQTEVLRSGRTMEVRGDPEAPLLFALNEIPRDEWDRWNEARDRDLQRSDSYRYVSRDIYGADDLAGHGRWVYDSPYGWVWAPRVSANWAPYRAGRWSWINHYGWTWVSRDPWGWAPYHYGRWYHASSHGWVWYPGAVGPRHHWRPALVAFFGWGSGIGVNVGVNFGFRNVGWVPLAPYEVYRPWYGRRNRTHVTVNNIVINNVNVVTNYRNARFNRGRYGVTSVPTRDFGRNQVTVNNFVRAHDRDLTRSGEVRGHMPFEPTRESRRFSDRTVTARARPGSDFDDSRFVRRPRNPQAAADASIAPFTRGPEQPNAGSVRESGRQNDGGQNQRATRRETGVTEPVARRTVRTPAVNAPAARTRPSPEASTAPPRRIRQPQAEPERRSRQSNAAATAPSNSRTVRAPAVNTPPARTRPSVQSRQRATDRPQTSAGPPPSPTRSPAVQNRQSRAPAAQTRPTPAVRRAPQVRSEAKPATAPPSRRRSPAPAVRAPNNVNPPSGDRNARTVRSPAPTRSAPAVRGSAQRNSSRGNAGRQDTAPAVAAPSNDGDSNSRGRGRRRR